jgi:acyl-CoA synthetase (AMP-forming)/AMP-acid ligase II/1-acyl-sn-glycerol-3-phosphate acyltransferase
MESLEPNPRRELVYQVLGELYREMDPAGQIEVTDSTHLEWDLGLGSLERAELGIRLERALGVSLPGQVLWAAGCVGDLLIALGQTSSTAESARVSFLSELPAFPESARSITEALHIQLQQQGARKLLFLLDGGHCQQQLSFQELWSDVAGRAYTLRQLGIQPSQRVALMLPTGLAFVASFLAIQWVGAVPVPLYPPFRADQAKDYLERQSAILKDSGASMLVSWERALAVTQWLRLDCPGLQLISADSLASTSTDPSYACESEQLGLIQYTSGSTGKPKGVALTHANLLHNIRAYGQALQVGAKDVCVSWLPLYHDMGLIGSLLGSLYHGLPLVLMGPQDFLARPASWLQAISDFQGSISCAPNFAYDLCASRLSDEQIQGLDLSSWRVALNGAEPISPATLDKFSKRFESLGFSPRAHFPAYGLAEAALAVTFSPLHRGPKIDRVDAEYFASQGVAKPNLEGQAWVSSGVPLPGTELRIVDEHGRALGDRHQGEIQFRSGSSLREYFQQPLATSAVKDREGWVKTGDLGYLAEGELYVSGRAKDLIIVAGRNLYPQDLEAGAAEIEGIRKGCVVAFSVTRPEGEKLVLACESRVPSPELVVQVAHLILQRFGVRPHEVVLLAPGSVPKTPSGKIRHARTRELYLTGKLGKSLPLWRQAMHLARRLPARTLLGGLAVASRLLFWLGVPALLLSRCSKTYAQSALRLGSRRLLSGLGLTLSESGRPPGGPCLIVCNHASVLDPVVILASQLGPHRFVVAPWIFELGWLRPALLRLGHLKASRRDPSDAERLAEEMSVLLQSGCPMVAFPEGGIESTPGLRQFQLGLFLMAVQRGWPIQLVALQGTRLALPWPRLIPLPTALALHWGPQLKPERGDWHEAVDFAERARDWIGKHAKEALLEQRLRRQA